MIRYPHTKNKEILITKIINPYTTLSEIGGIDISLCDVFVYKSHLDIFLHVMYSVFF